MENATSTDIATQALSTQFQVFGSAKPKEIVQNAQEIADSLVPIVEKKCLFTVIAGNKHVHVEGWTTMLALIGVFPEIEWAKQTSEKDEPLTYQARAILRHMPTGKVVGAGENICSKEEKSKVSFARYAIASMAETRAVGKAARLSFSWIMKLAGFAELPAEEVTDEMREEAKTKRNVTEPREMAVEAQTVANAGTQASNGLSKNQQGLIWAKLHEKFGKGQGADAQCGAWLKAKLVMDYAGVPLDQLHWKHMNALLKAVDGIQVHAKA